MSEQYPVDRLNQLAARPATPRDVAPFPHVVRSANLDLRVTADSVVGSVNLEGEVLTPGDRKAALDTIAAHLAPGGGFIFDTRNPAVEEWLGDPRVEAGSAYVIMRNGNSWKFGGVSRSSPSR